jgi:hypothetical protein
MGNAMTWHPVSREKFEHLLKEEIETLTPAALEAYEKYSKAPYEQPCLRDSASGIERVFVVARNGNGNRLLFFDDVEEEFGVGVPDSDGVLRDLGTLGPLVAAVLALDRIESTPQVTDGR